MAQLPSTVQLANFRSWFNDTDYNVRYQEKEMLKDPIFDLFGEDDSMNLSDTLSTTGIDKTGIALAKTPGGSVSKDAWIELDQHSVPYITFVKRVNYELETILHDKYRLLDPNGTDVIDQLWEAVGLFLTNCFWNDNTATTTTVLAHNGTISYPTTTPDGVSIINSGHSGPNYSSKTNIGGTGVLSGPNMVTNIQVGKQNFCYGSGQPKSYRPDAIIVPDVEPMVEQALQITGSQRVASSANNAVNIYSGGNKDVIVLKHAPRTNANVYDTTAADLYKWATAQRSMLKTGMKFKWIAKPQLIESSNIDDSNLDAFRTAFCRIAFLPEDPFCMVQNNATAAPATNW